METYKIQVGHVDSGKYKEVEVKFRRISAGERAEIKRKGKLSRKLNEKGEVSADLDEDILSAELIRSSIAEPKELKNVEELNKFDTLDFDNMLSVCMKLNPLAYLPSL